jgi:tetratricopeptide (TPR) repeat protein
LQHAVKALPADGLLHHYLGNALLQKGRLEEATRAYQKGVQIAPANEQLQFGLALCLLKNGDLQGAVTAYCQVVQLNPKNGDAWFTLGSSYLKLGRFEEALQAFRQAEKLGSIIPGYKFPQKPLQRAQQLADLDARFEAVRAGRTKPKDAAETVNLAILCSDYKEMYAAATKLFAEAFDASPQLADNVLNNYRFGAARCAVLASQRKGTDAKMLSDRELPRLRTQALGWLKADLSSWSKQASAGEDQRKQAQTALSLWQATSEFACVRDRAALNKLPETERAAWLDFWAAVGKVLGEAKGEGKPMAAKRG